MGIYLFSIRALYNLYSAHARGAQPEEHKRENEHGDKRFQFLYKSLYGIAKNLAVVRGDTLAIILLSFSCSAGRLLSYLGIIMSSADDGLSLLKADRPEGECGDLSVLYKGPI